MNNGGVPYVHEITPEFVSWWKRNSEATLKLIQEILKDKSQDLESRWKMYLEIRPYLKVEGSYMTFKTLEAIREVSWYDDFYLEKGETQHLDGDFIERAVEEFDLDDTQVISLKEEILQSGYGAFENDW